MWTLLAHKFLAFAMEMLLVEQVGLGSKTKVLRFDSPKTNPMHIVSNSMAERVQVNIGLDNEMDRG